MKANTKIDIWKRRQVKEQRRRNRIKKYNIYMLTVRPPNRTKQFVLNPDFVPLPEKKQNAVLSMFNAVVQKVKGMQKSQRGA